MVLTIPFLDAVASARPPVRERAPWVVPSDGPPVTSHRSTSGLRRRPEHARRRLCRWPSRAPAARV